jgi:hypothetical protein
MKFGISGTMKTTQPKTDRTSKRWRNRLWIGCFSFLLGLPLLYYGYCWGLWGRYSLLLQYLFQCSCPPASEEARYPEQVDVIISACRQSYVELSPSGRVLQVYEEKSEVASTYLLDLQSMQRIDAPNQSFSSFLTDDLGFVESGLEDYIVDRKTGIRYPIRTFRNWREDAYVNGEPNLELLISALQQAEQVFFTQSNDTVVILMSNFSTSPEQNFTFDRSDILGWNSNRVEQFLQENNIVYQTILVNYPHDVVSPNGRLIARDDGIYLNDTNQKIVDGYSFSRFYRPYSGKYLLVRGWTYDGTGVIYSQFSVGPCLIESNFLFGDDTGCFYEVPQPVLLLKVPEEYLLPQATP